MTTMVKGRWIVKILTSIVALIRHVALRNIILQQPTSCQEKNAKKMHKIRYPDLYSLPIDKMK